VVNDDFIFLGILAYHQKFHLQGKRKYLNKGWQPLTNGKKRHDFVSILTKKQQYHQNPHAI
jgi:hypothetical protein